MGMRGGPARRIAGNPLGGLLRDLDRRTRSTTRRRGRPVPPPVPVPQPEQSAPPRRRAEAAVVVSTDDTGRVRWEFPEPLAGSPVLSALPSGDKPLLVVVEEATRTQAVVRVWAALGEPAGPGVAVHLRVSAVTPA